jgi:hypothetical protein
VEKLPTTTGFDEIPENPEHASLGENGENDQEQIAVYVGHEVVSPFFLRGSTRGESAPPPKYFWSPEESSGRNNGVNEL